MPTARPFAYNSSGTAYRIAGTLQFGTMTIGGTAAASVYQGGAGLQWWNGPDEDSGYAIIAKPVDSENQPTPVVGPNQIADPTLSGATGGSLPTGWTASATPAGITITYGNVQTSGGINYFDITVSGTRTSGTGVFSIQTTSTDVIAAQGQNWGARYWFAVTSGTAPDPFFRIQEYNNTVINATSAFPVNPSGTLKLFTGNRLLTEATTNRVRSALGFTLANGVPVNFTLRVGSPIFGLQQLASVGFNRAANQAQFLQMAALLSSSSPSNEDQAVIALNGSNCWTNYNPATTSGLILSLDPGNNASYPDTGTDWWNLVSVPGGSFKATLSGATYSGSSGGVINFDDTELDYAQTVSALTTTSWSVEAWFRSGKSLAGKETAVVATVADGNGDIAFALGNYDSAQNFLDISSYKSGLWVSSGYRITPTVGTWYQLVGTYDGNALSFYQNGTPLGQTAIGNLPSVTTAVTLGRSGNIDESIDYFDGDISIVRIYNTSLSTGDVSKNWNANRARFGL